MESPGSFCLQSISMSVEVSVMLHNLIFNRSTGIYKEMSLEFAVPLSFTELVSFNLFNGKQTKLADVSLWSL